MEDSIKHIIKTTEQWNLTANQYKIIECGCLCVELCPDKTTKIKVGEGNKNYAQLPYISGTEADLSNYYTKAEVDRITNNLNRMKIASTEEYDSEHNLPLRGNVLGDVRFVKSPDPSVSTDPIEYLWNGNKWIYLGGMMFDVDLSDYVKREEIMPRVDVLERMAHTHQNKDILDHTEKPYTTKDKEKLDKLHNYDDTEVKRRITDLEKIDDFKGATSYRDGTSGYVPKPKRGDQNKFLRGDGKWTEVDTEIPVASETTLGGIKVGENLSIDENGVLSATGEGPEYTAGDGINIDDQNNEISVKIGNGLAFDENGAIEAPGGIEYVAGDAISIAHPPISLIVTHVKWVLLGIRTRSLSENIIQVGEFELYDKNNQLLTYSSINATLGSGTTPTYEMTPYQQTPDKMIDGDATTKMSCTNFTTTCNGLEIVMELMNSINLRDIKQYRYITADDVPERDPVTWDLYVSSDGIDWVLISQQVNDTTIPTAREVSTGYYDITPPTTDDYEINVKFGNGLRLDENGALEVVSSGVLIAGHGIEIDQTNHINDKLGVGLTFDADDAVTLDESIDLVFNCDYL